MVTFYWKVSSEEGDDYLEFYIDGDRQDRISGEVDWQKKTYDVNGTSPVTLKWRFVKDGSGGSGTHCGWVDFVRWTGSTINPPPDLTNWETINYKYDPSGRRIKKKVDNYTIRYLYDGGNVIGEYDINDNLLRKYIYGPRVDEPVCMIDVADSNAVYYYHYDGLGSVVALSDSDGDSVQAYEYSVYGQVAVEDPNHTNPYMFTGRRFDFETGLYYYRARYYNPYIGRFLQTDPVGYGDGLNWYAYCGNNPLNYVDPSGLNLARITYHLASDPNNTLHTKMKSGKEFIEFLDKMRDAGETIIFFEFVGHGVQPAKGEPSIGLAMGDGDVFGIGTTMKDWDAEEGKSTDHTWYGIEDYSELLTEVFDPCAVIELESCNTADGTTSIGYEFKKHLPSTSVWGYTGRAQYYIPGIPIIWETRSHPFDLDSKWVEISLQLPIG